MKTFEIFSWSLLDHLSTLTSTFFLLERDERMLSLKKHKRPLADCKHSSDELTPVCPLLLVSACEVDFGVRTLCNDLVRWRNVVKSVVLGMFPIIYLWTWRLQQWFRLENSRWIPSVQSPPLPWIFGTIPSTSFACPWVATGVSSALPANPVGACRFAGFRSAVQKNMFSSWLSWEQSPELLPENYLHQGSAEFFFAFVLAFHQIKDLLLGDGLGVALLHLLQQQSVFLVIGFLRFSLDVKKERAQKVTCIWHDKLPQDTIISHWRSSILTFRPTSIGFLSLTLEIFFIQSTGFLGCFFSTELCSSFCNWNIQWSISQRRFNKIIGQGWENVSNGGPQWVW